MENHRKPRNGGQLMRKTQAGWSANAENLGRPWKTQEDHRKPRKGGQLMWKTQEDHGKPQKTTHHSIFLEKTYSDSEQGRVVKHLDLHHQKQVKIKHPKSHRVCETERNFVCVSTFQVYHLLPLHISRNCIQIPKYSLQIPLCSRMYVPQPISQLHGILLWSAKQPLLQNRNC